jgi:hypothetical protein
LLHFALFIYCVYLCLFLQQLSGDKTEKKRVVVDSIILDSPAAEAGLQRVSYSYVGGQFI